jgi:NAD-dependent SIR2 family protein deacetylase
MKFIDDGPDIPDDLIDAVAAGNVVFICGAGVSKRAGLPLFRELVEQVYRTLGEPFNNGPEEPAEKKAYDEGDYDRVLRALEKRIQPPGAPRSLVREKVAEMLQPKGAPLHEHCALLRISRQCSAVSVDYNEL